MNTTTCTWDTGSMYGNAPACSKPATHVVSYRDGTSPIFKDPACQRHARLIAALADSGHIETVALP